MADGFEVYPATLRGYARLVREQASRLEQVHRALTAVDVAAGAFGKLPESADMHSAYSQHASAEVANTAGLPGLLDQVADGLVASAENYEEVESANAQSARFVADGLGGAG
jgi:hypothetical protein